MMSAQSGMMDVRAGVVADRLVLASSAYPFFVAGTTGTITLDIAIANEGLSSGGTLTRDFSYGWLSYSLDGDPPAGSEIQIYQGNTKLVYHTLTQKGERTMAIPFTFLSGQANCSVRIYTNETVIKKTLCLHNVR